MKIRKSNLAGMNYSFDILNAAFILFYTFYFILYFTFFPQIYVFSDFHIFAFIHFTCFTCSLLRCYFMKTVFNPMDGMEKCNNSLF